MIIIMSEITITSDQVSRLFLSSPPCRAPGGTTLFRAGDPVRNIHYVVSGCLSLRRVSETGTRMILQLARPGDILAEASAYSDTYHCDGVSVTDTEYRTMFKPAFAAHLKRDPALQQDWMQRLAKGIQTARIRAEIRGLKTVSARLDMWLMLGGPMPPKGQWHLVAAEIGVSPEALYREMKQRKDL